MIYVISKMKRAFVSRVVRTRLLTALPELYMEKIKTVIDNKWFKFGVSFAGIISAVVMAYFDYIVFFYNIEYTNKKVFAVMAPVFCVLVALLSLYTRRSPVTAVIAMVNCLLFFPLLLLDWGNWPLLVPAAALTVFCFFNCHMNETLKTIFGTFFLLLYILGGIVFYLFTNVFGVSTVNTLVDTSVSPSGAFRCYVIDAKNKATGKKYVYIQPNTLDIDKGFMRLDTTIKKLVRQEANPVEFTCEWEGPQLYINGEEYFNENNYIKIENGEARYDIADRGWTYTYFSLDFPISTTVNTFKSRIDNFLSRKKEDEEPEVVVITRDAERSTSDEAETEGDAENKSEE